MNNLSELKVAVLGCGRSGIAAARWAIRVGVGELCLFDSSAHARCADASITLIAGAGDAEAQAFGADLVILSPGIEGDSAWVQAFCAPKNAPLIGETEFASRYFKGTIVAITGTNGKTTTCALMEHILNRAGMKAMACGNYGIPLSEVLLEHPEVTHAALEVSSFQMETIVEFKPHVAIWLNFAPDHMDRYREVQDYYEAKKRIFENMSPEQVAIVRVGEDVAGIAPSVQYFSAESEEGTLSYDRVNNCIMQAGHCVLELNSTRMFQAHNAENTMACLLAARELGISDACVQAALAEFVPPTHRCEMVAEFDRILWLNDSKSTNLHSTEAALRSQTRPVILIIGGKDKGLDYSPLIPLIHESVRTCICFGQIGAQLHDLLRVACPCELVETVPQCVELAARIAEQGDVVLFSPATSSFDQFSGYAERGQCFRNAVIETIKP